MSSDFTPLPIAGGVGEYHLNRFRVAFDASKLSAIMLPLAVNGFFRGFGKYLKSKAAKVDTATGKTHDDKPTFEFTGTATLGGSKSALADAAIPDFAHTDWVYVLDRSNNSFTGQTLKRNFTTVLEDAALIAARIRGPATAAAVQAAIVINQHHFLAGRRAWRLDHGSVFGYSGNVRVLETVAVERFSLTAYSQSGAVIGDIATLVRNVWLNLLKNYIRDEGFSTVGTPPGGSGWTADGHYHSVQLSFADANTVAKSPHMSDLKTLYPHVAKI